MKDEHGTTTQWLDHFGDRESGTYLARPVCPGRFLKASVLAYTGAERRQSHSYAAVVPLCSHVSWRGLLRTGSRLSDILAGKYRMHTVSLLSMLFQLTHA